MLSIVCTGADGTQIDAKTLALLPKHPFLGRKIWGLVIEQACRM